MTLKLKQYILFAAFSVSSLCVLAQIPKSGTYTYKVAFDEWGGKTLGATCIVIIKGHGIKVINDGSLTGKKGDILEEGTIMKHKRTGKYIIGHNPNDVNSKEIGGCGDGPMIVDFKHKKVISC